MNVPLLCLIQKAFKNEYQTSGVCGIGEVGVQIRAANMTEVAPLDEWEESNFSSTGPMRFKYFTMVDGVKFFALGETPLDVLRYGTEEEPVVEIDGD